MTRTVDTAVRLPSDHTDRLPSVPYRGTAVGSRQSKEKTTDGSRPSARLSANVCDECGGRMMVMLAMVPGPDGIPWSLCSRCWRGEGDR